MRRESSVERADWRERCDALGFGFHSMGGVYWDERACWRFTEQQIDHLEAVTETLHGMCLAVVYRVVQRGDTERFGLSVSWAERIERAWRAREPSLFGRFDLSWSGSGEPKLLEYNADTPTSLIEASVVQWDWLESLHPQADQFNSLHEQLIARWPVVAGPAGTTVHFACAGASEEDGQTLAYLADTAQQAGLAPQLLGIEEIGWDGRQFIGTQGETISRLFKLYPWEWMAGEAFGAPLLRSDIQVIEPSWKMLLANKMLLVALWEQFPGHPNLLAAGTMPHQVPGDRVRKPLLSREGANVSMYLGGQVHEAAGPYGAEGFIYQAAAPLPCVDGNHAVIGSWIVGDHAAGIGMREDDTPITTDAARFLPHYFV